MEFSESSSLFPGVSVMWMELTVLGCCVRTRAAGTLSTEGSEESHASLQHASRDALSKTVRLRCISDNFCTSTFSLEFTECLWFLHNVLVSHKLLFIRSLLVWCHNVILLSCNTNRDLSISECCRCRWMGWTEETDYRKAIIQRWHRGIFERSPHTDKRHWKDQEVSLIRHGSSNSVKSSKLLLFHLWLFSGRADLSFPESISSTLTDTQNKIKVCGDFQNMHFHFCHLSWNMWEVMYCSLAIDWSE